MNKNKLLNVIVLSLIIFICIGIKNSVYATGSFSIKASKTSVNVGDTVTISITGNDAYGQINISATNASLSSSSVFLQNDTKTVTLTAKTPGVITVTASPSSAGLGDSAENPITGSKSLSITVQGNSSSKPSSGGSSTSSKKSVKMINTNPDFTGFNPSNKGPYKLTVENNISKITGTVTYTDGSKNSFTRNLQEGTNNITVEGYTIKVIRKTSEDDVIPNVGDEQEETEQKLLRLENLVLDDTLNIKLEPNFDPEIFEYKVILGNDYLDLEELLISAIPNVDSANITIDGNKNLKDGENIVTITVESEGLETVTYTIIVIKGPVEDAIETVAQVSDIDENLLNNSKELLKKRIILCTLIFLIALIGIVFIIKERIESKKNKEGKRKDKYEEEYQDENFEDNNYNEKEIEETTEEDEEKDILERIFNKDKNEVEDIKQPKEIEETENPIKEKQEDKTEDKTEEKTENKRDNKTTIDEFFNSTKRIEFEEEKSTRRRHGKGKHS